MFQIHHEFYEHFPYFVFAFELIEHTDIAPEHNTFLFLVLHSGFK